MRWIIRQAEPSDIKKFSKIRRLSVLGLACDDYPRKVLNEWAGLDQNSGALFSNKIDKINKKEEYAWVLEYDGLIEGYCILAPQMNRIRSIYLTKKAHGKGFGKKLLSEMENKARCLGLRFLQLESSLTAGGFYLSQGYRILKKDKYKFKSGTKMDCLYMRKEFL